MSSTSTPDVLVHTEYTTCHWDDMGFCASNISFEVGAVVVNEKDEILIFEDLNSGMGALPRFTVESGLQDVAGCNTSPFDFIRNKAGLDVERLPLLKPRRRYKNPDAGRWNALRGELTFQDDLTTSPFSVSLNISWFRMDSDPTFPDGRQAVVNWYSGIVRGAPPQAYDRLCAGLRVRFVPFDEAVSAVFDHDYGAETALCTFEAVWAATKRLQSDRSRQY